MTTEQTKYSNALKQLSKAKIKRSQFPIMEYVDARGIRYKAVLKTKSKKWKAGTGGIRTKEVIVNLIYKRVV